MSEGFDYPRLLRRATLGLVRDLLLGAAADGLPGEHHFYLTFDTRQPGVELPATLASRYPESMTIVLQNQWADLEVGDEEFAVTLRFGGVWERLQVPFDALASFLDPSVPFGLDFTQFAAAAAAHEPEPAPPAPPAAPAAEAEAEASDAERGADVLRFRPR